MKTAMILCAGFGTRLRHYTKDTPKVMLDVHGKPLLEHTMIHLSNLGFSNIIINLHYLPEHITSYFGDGGKWGLNIRYSYEESLLGTAGSVKKAESMLSSNDVFMVLYGDILCRQNYNDLISAHTKNRNAVATIVIHKRRRSNSIIAIDDNFLITTFIERPVLSDDPAEDTWVNSSLYCFGKKIFEYIPAGSACDFPRDIFPKLISRRSLYGFPLNGYRCAVDSEDRYKQAINEY